MNDIQRIAAASISRRSLLKGFLCGLCVTSASSALSAPAYPIVTPGRRITFPADRGSHPLFRIEWWYITGHLETAKGTMGFQVTFFRVRNAAAESNPGRFSPKQLLFAHGAVAAPGRGRLFHDQRSARVLDGLVVAREGETGVAIDDWHLRRDGDTYRTRLAGDEFALALTLTPTQPPLLQGDGGFSRKGPDPAQASYYYSEPHLRVAGSVTLGAETIAVDDGVAWLDHEWSSEVLAKEASGWDWVGVNLDGGAALMAFRIRGRDGGVLWAGGTYRPAGGDPVAYAPADVRFAPRRAWRSPRTGIDYPVALDIEVGGRRWHVTPLLDDQELDARASTGTLYWEGAVMVRSDDGTGGRGYLELTGYAERVPF